MSMHLPRELLAPCCRSGFDAVVEIYNSEVVTGESEEFVRLRKAIKKQQGLLMDCGGGCKRRVLVTLQHGVWGWCYE